MMKSPIDQPQRDLALDPTQSFIVQAPAGAGKTELLIQRILVLLSCVNAPEEVVGITFTRKAAFEMRERILRALSEATNPKPSALHAQKTWQLAKAVLLRDQALGWGLLENAHRLRLQTIDSLSQSLVHQAPLSSEMGSIAQIAEEPDALYRLAIRRLFEGLEENAAHREALKTILLHLDNHYAKAEALLSSMLKTRDQWLRHIFSGNDRECLEAALKNVNRLAVERCAKTFPPDCKEKLSVLMRFAKENKEDALPWSFPTHRLEDKPHWLAVKDLLLTSALTWREKVDKRQGFPVGTTQAEKIYFKSMKDEFKELIKALQAHENFFLALKDLSKTPSIHYEEHQWEVLSALMKVLHTLVGELKLVFYEKNRVDFIEMSQAARQALGSAEEPTDLALYMDYNIQHLLIDEFQDTSVTQFSLIEQLIAGWEKGDGRTLFLVGDPMQSIYRFRQAEVGFFLLVQAKGMAHVSLTPLTLGVNFRSQQGLIDELNACFKHLFPKISDVAQGAVPFCASQAFHPASKQPSVFFHAVSKEEEGEKVVRLIRQSQAEHPHGSIAVLVRSRSHLEDIIPYLKKASLDFQATEIEPLKEQTIIYDAKALTHAMLCPLDQMAWLSVFRAPWCGLTLKDLHQLANGQADLPLWETLLARSFTLSEDGNRRLNYVLNIIVPAILNRSRSRVRDWIEGVWNRLNAPYCYPNPHVLESYLQLLDKLEEEQGTIVVDELERRLDKLYALSDTQNEAAVRLMTIHKSKGLEFDTVIIPGLNRKPRGDTKAVLKWLEQPNDEAGVDLILAPMGALGDADHSIYAYLNEQDKKKQSHEQVRLLYVAATRAKQSLHLVAAEVNPDKGGVPGSFLSLLEGYFKEAAVTRGDQNKEKDLNKKRQTMKLRRLKSEYFKMSPSSDVISMPGHQVPEFVDSHRIYQQKLGKAIHAALERVGKMPLNRVVYRKILANEGLYSKETVLHLEKVISTVMNDEQGRWLLSSSHPMIEKEYAIHYCEGDEIKQAIIDLTFVDNHNIRWIVDYKTSQPIASQSLNEFLEEMKLRYSEQMHRYANVMQQLDKRPIKLGLYFPLIPAWCEWENKGYSQN